MGIMCVDTGRINVNIYTQQNSNWTGEDANFATYTFTKVHKNTVANRLLAVLGIGA